MPGNRSGVEHAHAASSLNFLLRLLGEEPSLHDHRYRGKIAFSQNLEDARCGAVDDRCAAVRPLLLGQVRLASVGGDQAPQLLAVHGELLGTDNGVLAEAEVTHADLTEITGVVLVEVDAVVVLTTGITVTSRVLPVLADAPMTGGDVTALLAVLAQTGGHRSGVMCFAEGTDNAEAPPI